MTGLELLEGPVMGWWKGLCGQLKAASYKGWTRREKEGSQERRKPAIPRNDNISSFVEGTARDWISFFLSRVIIAFWVGVIVNPKKMT